MFQTPPLGPEPISGHLRSSSINKLTKRVHFLEQRFLTSLLGTLRSVSSVLVNENLLKVSVPHSIIGLLLKLPTLPPFFLFNLNRQQKW